MTIVPRGRRSNAPTIAGGWRDAVAFLRADDAALVFAASQVPLLPASMAVLPAEKRVCIGGATVVLQRAETGAAGEGEAAAAIAVEIGLSTASVMVPGPAQSPPAA